ncbi:hypothetical protein PBY51_003636 [Eleginops maclovinus]|uniref:Uncharacterized protein n=1 Tax=Eleginops maclovinus TaxID=56733 RepID=A0AAN7Y0F6_ELEMC|nr:hypothetical protein PBY51_003636 [Eleginops maclovinus]
MGYLTMFNFAERLQRIPARSDGRPQRQAFSPSQCPHRCTRSYLSVCRPPACGGNIRGGSLKDRRAQCVFIGQDLCRM